jgi:hypothetical protein
MPHVPSLLDGVDERRAGERRDVVCDAWGLYIAPQLLPLFRGVDPTTYAVKRHTPLLSLTEPIEYTLGFKYFSKTNEFLFGYSKMDRVVILCQIGY